MNSYNDILSGELSKLLRQELSTSLQGLFSRGNAGGGGINVVIHNNVGANVTAREVGGGGLDRKYLEITIDQMVANSLLRGRQTSGVMRTLFGIVPGLIGR